MTKTIDEISELNQDQIIKKIKPKTIQKIQDLKSALDHRYGKTENDNLIGSKDTSKVIDFKRKQLNQSRQSASN